MDLIAMATHGEAWVVYSVAEKVGSHATFQFIFFLFQQQ